MTTKTIVGYLYRDEYYCPGCIVSEVCPPWRNLDMPAESGLNNLAKIINLNRSRPASFSQRDFPHTITNGQLDEPARCDTCMEEIR